MILYACEGKIREPRIFSQPLKSSLHRMLCTNYAQAELFKD